MAVKGLKRFTADEDATIIRLVRMGKGAKEITEILGRSPKSVRNRLAWLKSRGMTAPEPGSQMKLAACAAPSAEKTVAADPVSEIRSRIAELKKREAELTGQLDDVRDEMAGIFAQLTELIGAVK